MSFGCKRHWLGSALVLGMYVIVTYNAKADDGSSSGVAARAPCEACAGAPRHRMNQALIGDSPQEKSRSQSVARLSDLLRRLGCGEGCCPLCGRAEAAEIEAASENESGPLPSSTATLFPRFLANDRVDEDKAKSGQKRTDGLRPGEPAQVILDLKRRLGNDVFDGTEFGGSPEALVEWIRTLDEESRCESPQNEASEEQDESATDPSDAAGNTAFQISALREAARKLGEAADLLEDQNLFDAADEVRSTAEELRLRAREKFQGKNAPAKDLQ